MSTETEDDTTMIKVILETQAKHGEKLGEISATVGDIRNGVRKIEEEGLQHLKSIASSASVLANTDELKVKIIKGQGLNTVLIIVVLLAFVLAVFAVIENYDIRMKHGQTSIETTK